MTGIKSGWDFLGFFQLSVNDYIEDEESEEGDDGGGADPGPGSVPHDVVLGQPQPGWSHIQLVVVATPTRRKVQTKSYSFGFEKFW